MFKSGGFLVPPHSAPSLSTEMYNTWYVSRKHECVLPLVPAISDRPPTRDSSKKHKPTIAVSPLPPPLSRPACSLACRRKKTRRNYSSMHLAFKPLGGSFVIFTPFWRIDTGNSLQGIEVSHSRKSLCTVSGLRSSQSRSSSASQEIYKWQFCRYT